MRTHVHYTADDLHRLRPHLWPATIMACVLIALYLASMLVPPGLGSYIPSSIAMVVIAMTALARVNDITPEQVALRWQMRRLGLVMAGAGALTLALVPWFTGDWPTWKETTFYVGVALTWLTTPHMPPWSRYITGQYRTVREAKLAEVASQVSGLDPRDDAPQYVQGGAPLPPGVPKDRRVARTDEDGP
jgi:hypothetical protein